MDSHHRPVKKNLRQNAKRMRGQPTDAESAMWLLLRDRRLTGFKFRRQVPFRNYILDFVGFAHRIVVEIDGSQHASASSDAVRDAILAREGFRVIRYWNNDVLQRRSAVLEDLHTQLTRNVD